MAQQRADFRCASPRSTSARTRRGCSSRTSTDGRSTRSTRRVAITRLGEGVDARRRLLPVPIARVRNCLADYRRDARAPRRRAHAPRRDERGARRRERRGVPRRDRVELRLRDAPAVRRRGGDADVPRRDVGARSTPGRSISTSAAARPSCRRASRTACAGTQPRHRLRSADGAVPPVATRRPQDELDALRRRRARAARRGCPTTSARRARRSASPARSRRSPRSTSGSRSTTASASTATARRRRRVETQLDRLAALPLAERRDVPGLEPERAPVIVAGAVILREVAAPLRARRDRGQRARPPRRRRARGGRAARAGGGRRAAGRLHLLLSTPARSSSGGSSSASRRCTRSRERHPDEAAVLDDRHALEVALLEERGTPPRAPSPRRS